MWLVSVCVRVLQDGGFWVGQCYSIQALLVSGYWQPCWWRLRKTAVFKWIFHLIVPPMMMFFMYMVVVGTFIILWGVRTSFLGWPLSSETMGHLMSNWRFQYRFVPCHYAFKGFFRYWFTYMRINQCCMLKYRKVV